MRLTIIALVLCACVWVSTGDVVHLKATKTKLLGRLAGKGKHHKRGIYSTVPTYKLGHDIPLVTHSVVKPVVVGYPPTSSVTAVKVPITRPHTPHYPVVHKSPIHNIFGNKFAHNTKTFVVPKPDQHFHHHHHHVAPRPLLPTPAAPALPIIPVAQPTNTVAHPLPAPPPSVFIHRAPVVPAEPTHIAPAPVPLLPPEPIHPPVLPAASIPFSPASIVPASVLPLTAQYPYVLRPGNSVQTSLFATYPRYPLLNYQSPFIPLAPPVAPAPVSQVFLDRPQPQCHLFSEPTAHDGVLEHQAPVAAVDQPNVLHLTQAIVPQTGVHLHHQPEVHLQQQPEVHLHPQPEVHLQPQPELHLHPQPNVHLHSQPDVHLQQTNPGVHIDHNGWSPVPSQAHDHPVLQSDVHHFSQPHDGYHVTQEQGTQVYEHHTGNEQQFHDLHQLQHHIQQLEQAQYEQNLHNHNINPEYGTPQDFGHQQHVNQDYDQHQDFHQNQDFGPSQQQPVQEYGLPGQEYGLPHQALEGRNEGNDGEEDTQNQQLYHNHIPLGLQPPIDRPLEHFR